MLSCTRGVVRKFSSLKRSDFNHLSTQLEALTKKFDTRLDAMESKFDRRFDAFDHKIDSKLADHTKNLQGWIRLVFGATTVVIAVSSLVSRLDFTISPSYRQNKLYPSDVQLSNEINK